MTLLTDLAAALTALVPAEATIFPSNFEPPSPDNCLTLYGTSGVIGARSLSGDVQEDRSAQLRFRDTSQQNLQARVEAVYLALKVPVTYAPANLRLWAKDAPLYSYPRDANKRSIASFNLIVLAGE